MDKVSLLPNIQGRGNKSSGDNFHAAPNIDHSQEFVRKDLKEWLCWLRLIFSDQIFFNLLLSQNVFLSEEYYLGPFLPCCHFKPWDRVLQNCLIFNGSCNPQERSWV